MRKAKDSERDEFWVPGKDCLCHSIPEVVAE